jgi:hypothetical protein
VQRTLLCSQTRKRLCEDSASRDCDQSDLVPNVLTSVLLTRAKELRFASRPVRGGRMREVKANTEDKARSRRGQRPGLRPHGAAERLRRPRRQGKLEDAGQLDTTIIVFSTDNDAEAISLPDGDVIPRAVMRLRPAGARSRSGSRAWCGCRAAAVWKRAAQLTLAPGRPCHWLSSTSESMVMRAQVPLISGLRGPLCNAIL